MHKLTVLIFTQTAAVWAGEVVCGVVGILYQIGGIVQSEVGVAFWCSLHLLQVGPFTVLQIHGCCGMVVTAYGICASSRARKLSAIKSFYKYLTIRTKQLQENPVADLEYPKLRKSLPKYLTLEESSRLLQAVSGPNEKRDYAILMLFLNCGIRRSELVGLNLTDVYEDRIRVVGKGNKERFVYFGSACRKAIDSYLLERNEKILTDNRALFGSRNGNRISVEAVHRLVKKALLQAGLDSTQFSAHKLRHTAATMMLSGGVDVKTVQEVLGHENLNTTQIYTHIENTELKLAAEANPLSKLDFINK